MKSGPTLKRRLDKALVEAGLTATRSEAESWVKLGRVKVNGRLADKTGLMVGVNDLITLDAPERYVSRAGLKLASVSAKLGLDFKAKTVLDVGSSTGGFTDYALQHGAARVTAVDVGSGQMHPTLRSDPRVELHEQTDIRSFVSESVFDIIVIDVSFISLREILPSIIKFCGSHSLVVAMVKPQFEAGRSNLDAGGIVKNDRLRRQILKDFETWVSKAFVILDKADSSIRGAKGNLERFYLLRPYLQKK